MEVTILKNRKVLAKDWQKLDDIKYNSAGNHLGQLIDQESQPVYFFPHQKSIVDDVRWCDVFDTGTDNRPSHATFMIEETGIDRYVLKMNGKNVIAFDFSDEESPRNIESILPPDYYKVGKIFFECIHWTRDFLEFEAKKCLDTMEINRDILRFLSNYYISKDFDKKNSHRYAKTVIELDKAEDINAVFELKYLLSQVQYVYNNYKDDSEKKDMIFKDWLEKKSWARIIMEWGESGKSVANVEFSNYGNFVEIYYDSFFKLSAGEKKKIKLYLDMLKDQRNLLSHNVRNLVEQKWTELSEAIDNMVHLMEKFGEMSLRDCLNQKKENIERICKNINGITNK